MGTCVSNSKYSSKYAKSTDISRENDEEDSIYELKKKRIMP